MYALVNTMSRSDRIFGRIISRHRSIEAAVKADRALQRAVKRGNGQASYLPTIVVHVHAHGGQAALRSSEATRQFCTEVDTTEARAA